MDSRLRGNDKLRISADDGMINGFPPEFTPYLIRGGNDKLGIPFGMYPVLNVE
jgi:hypothetical protein